MAFFHDLQQHVVNVRMGLLDFVEQNHRVRTTTNAFGQLTTFFEADKARRSSDEAADVVAFLVLAHVDLHEGVLVPEHELGQRLRQQRLTHPGWAGEQERRHRTLGVLQTTAATTDSLADELDPFVLGDDPLVQFTFHREQTHRVFTRQASERYAGHLGNDFRDDLRVDDAIGFLGLLTPFAGNRFLLLLELVGLIAERRRFLKVLVGDCFFLLSVHALNVAVEVLQIWWTDHRLQPDACSRFVDDVDCLVRQTAARDVPGRQFDSLLKGVVGVLHAMVSFVTVLEALQDLDRLRLGRRIDHHHLEPAFQGAVLLDVLAVLVEGRRTDTLQFATAQSRLQHVRSIDRAFRSTGSDEGVQFVDEEDDIASPADFVHDRFDTFFKLTAVLRAGDHHRQVEDHDPLVTQWFRDCPIDDHLGQTFDDGCLTDTGFAEQDWVVLLPTAEDLHDAFDFVLASDDRIELGLLGQFGQIATKAVEGRGSAAASLASTTFPGLPAGFASLTAAFAGFALFGSVTEQIQHFFANIFELQPEVHQHLSCDAFLLSQQAQQKMLGSDVVVVEVTGLFHRVLDDLFRPWGLGQLAHRDHVGTRLDNLLDFQADLPQINVQILQDVGGDSRAFFDQAEEDVLGSNIFVIESLGLLVGQLHDLAGPIGETLVHRRDSIEKLPRPSGRILRSL